MLLSLFNNIPLSNILPCDGLVLYHGVVFSKDECKHHLNRLIDEVCWKQDEVVMFGKHFATKRKVAWYGDDEYAYTYSNITRKALRWDAHLLQLKNMVEALSGSTYNSCLLNLYHNGQEGMGWHSDDEPDLLKYGTIASLSFGAPRRFLFKHKHNGQRTEILLEAGSLLLMKGATQEHWMHSIPASRRVLHPRVNLTFRTMAVGHK